MLPINNRASYKFQIDINKNEAIIKKICLCIFLLNCKKELMKWVKKEKQKK